MIEIMQWLFLYPTSYHAEYPAISAAARLLETAEDIGPK
jgi:hypothetical protein